MTRITVAAAPLILPAALITLAAALTWSSSPVEARITERKHDVRVNILDGTARFVIEREFVKGGTEVSPATIYLHLPGAGSFENAMLDWGNGWQPLQTLRRGEANRAFNSRRSKSQKPSSADGPTVPILLHSSSREVVALKIAMIRPGTAFSLRYTVVAPTCNANGRNTVGYPYERKRMKRFNDRLKPTLQGNVELAPDGHALAAEKGDLTQQACHGSHGGAGGQIIASVPSSPTVAVRWASLATKSGEIGRLEIDLPTIVDPPTNASVVFVLDGSYSMNDRRLRMQLALVRSVIRQFPNPNVQLIVYDRTARRLFSGFVGGHVFERSLRAVAGESLQLANGSNLEDGLAAAAQQLAGRSGPQRIIAFSDNALRKRFSVTSAVAGLRPLAKTAVVHLIDYQAEFGLRARALLENHRSTTQPAHRLAPVGTAFGGIVMQLEGRIREQKQADSILRHLVVPTRLDQVSVDAEGLVRLNFNSIPLATGLRAFTRRSKKRRQADAPSSEIARSKLSGFLWSTRFEKTFGRTVSLQRDLGSLIVGDERGSGIRKPELRRLGLRLGAVSSETAMFWPGHRVNEKKVEAMGFTASIKGYT